MNFIAQKYGLSVHVLSEVGMLADLDILDLRSNKMNGPTIEKKHFTKFKHLLLSGNSLTFAG
jgi:hypothetical protein